MEFDMVEETSFWFRNINFKVFRPWFALQLLLRYLSCTRAEFLSFLSFWNYFWMETRFIFRLAIHSRSRSKKINNFALNTKFKISKIHPHFSFSSIPILVFPLYQFVFFLYTPYKTRIQGQFCSIEDIGKTFFANFTFRNFKSRFNF